MEFFELIESGLRFATVERLLSAPEPVKHLLSLGLPMKTIKRISGSESCAFNGTMHTRKVADMRGHHLTQKDLSPRYALRDPTSAARKASKDLKKLRVEMINVQLERFLDNKSSKFIPLPGCTMGKEETAIRRPRKAFHPEPSQLFSVIDIEDLGAKENFEEVEKSEETKSSKETESSKEKESFEEMETPKETETVEEVEKSQETENFEEMDNSQGMGKHKKTEHFFDQICDLGDVDTNMIGSNHGTYIGGSKNDGEVEPEEEVTDSTSEEPDDYDIEMAKAEDDMLFKELFGDAPEPSLRTVFFNPVNQEEPERQAKRKRESVMSPESSKSDLTGDFDHVEKRRKLARGTSSSQVSPPGLRKKAIKERGGELKPCDLFCRASTLAAVFQAVVAVGGFETGQEDSSDAPELDSLDLELLGEEPSNSQQTQHPANQDVKVIISETLYTTVSHDDIRVARAAANYLEIQQGNSNASELDSVDRKVLKEAFG